LVTLFSWLRLAETHAEARDRGADQRSFASYKILLASPRFMTQVFFGSCLLSLPFTVISGAPYVGIEIMGLSPSAYGKLFALPAAASFVGFLSAARLTRRWGARRMMRIGLTTATIGASSMLLLFALHVWHPMALFIPAMLVCFSNALAMPASMTAAIAVHPEVAGAASGLLGFVQLAIAALCSELVALFANHTPFPLAGIEFGLVCGALLLWGMIGRQPR
jgi:DHA1 family bicyclomycin/chloramphenicol resistance-like MFS transporter